MTREEFNNLMKDSILLGMGSEEEDEADDGESSSNSGSTNVIIEGVQVTGSEINQSYGG